SLSLSLSLSLANIVPQPAKRRVEAHLFTEKIESPFILPVFYFHSYIMGAKICYMFYTNKIFFMFFFAGSSFLTEGYIRM
ncbi:MAG: hypothetical protein LBF85_07270, partial [Tannerella sp.]|nr:hypothetical protein [Tannerella sp.]